MRLKVTLKLICKLQGVRESGTKRKFYIVYEFNNISPIVLLSLKIISGLNKNNR